MNNYEIDSPYGRAARCAEGTSAALQPTPESPHQRNAVLFRKLGGTDRSRNVFVDSSLDWRKGVPFNSRPSDKR